MKKQRGSSEENSAKDNWRKREDEICKEELQFAQINGGKTRPGREKDEVKKEVQRLFARLVALEKAQ